MSKPEAAAAAPRCRPSSRLLASAALAAASVALLLSVAALLAATSATRGLGPGQGAGLEAEHDLLVTSRPDLCLDTPDPGPCTSTVPRRDHTYSQTWSAI